MPSAVHKKNPYQISRQKLKNVLRKILGTNSLLPFSVLLLAIGTVVGLQLTQNSTELRQQAAYAGCDASATQINVLFICLIVAFIAVFSFLLYKRQKS